MNPDKESMVPDEDFKEQIRRLLAKVDDAKCPDEKTLSVPVEILRMEIPMQYRALILIASRPGGVSVDELMEFFDVGRNTIRGVLAALAAKGLVTRDYGTAYYTSEKEKK